MFPRFSYDGDMWYKVGSRKADSISKVSVAGLYSIKDGKISKFALAFGANAVTVRRSHELEKEIEGLTQKNFSIDAKNLLKSIPKLFHLSMINVQIKNIV